MRAELQEEAISLGVIEKVKFLGIRHDIPVLLSLADLFVFPSRFEGMPNAVLEAMSHGLPVIATAVQGVDEIIRDGENGLLVPVEDPIMLSDAILRLLKNPDERRRLGSAARETIPSCALRVGSRIEPARPARHCPPPAPSRIGRASAGPLGKA